MFEFDPAKSAANLAKHGIDFDEAQALWSDNARVVVDARSVVERRWFIIGRLHGKIWTVVFTRRDESIRIISARRARPNEARRYEQNEDD